jgi:hypothetical protein
MTSTFTCRLVGLATGAVADVELVADHRKHHRVRAIKQLAVGDGVVADAGRELRRPPAVPAGPMSIFGGFSSGLVHELLGLLGDVSGRQRGAFAEKKVLHVLGDELLSFFLPRHQPVLVEDHLHAILPELPGLRRNVLVHPLTELAGPRRSIEAGELLLKLLAEDLASGLVADRKLR